MAPRPGFRWHQAVAGASEPAQLALFDPPARQIGRGEFRGLEFVLVRSRSILNRVPDGSGLPFRWTVNAYRGCSHACTYCFARPTHEYLGLGPGDDFDRVIVVKIDAVERLRAELAPSRWGGEPVAMGTNTDPYQRAEGKFRLTRGIVETLLAADNPFSILTKGTLVLRDLDLLADAARRVPVAVNLSVGTLDEDVWRLTEPGTPHPRLRLDAVARLNDAGVPCGVLIAPVLPGLSDRPEQLDAVVKGAVEAGARSIGVVPLRLRGSVREHYLARLAEVRPDAATLTARRLGPRASLGPAARANLGALVARLVRKHRTKELRGWDSNPQPCG